VLLETIVEAFRKCAGAWTAFERPFPNHIVLNTESAQASWETLSQEWISEDGLYDHLVLKLPLG
jgi:hypothetical protein